MGSARWGQTPSGALFQTTTPGSMGSNPPGAGLAHLRSLGHVLAQPSEQGLALSDTYKGAIDCDMHPRVPSTARRRAIYR